MLLRLLPILPKARVWIRRTLGETLERAVAVSTFGFKRLGQYYPDDLLESTKVVLTAEVPVPPLAEWGLNRASLLEPQQTRGITFHDTFFVRSNEKANESLFFHEMVHVVQWQELGLNRYLALYGVGLAQHGYRNSPLEVMAYDLQVAFDDPNIPAFNALARTRTRTDQLLEQFRRSNLVNRLALKFL